MDITLQPFRLLEAQGWHMLSRLDHSVRVTLGLFAGHLPCDDTHIIHSPERRTRRPTHIQHVMYASLSSRSNSASIIIDLELLQGPVVRRPSLLPVAPRRRLFRLSRFQMQLAVQNELTW
jgi:hypothetical protein